MRKARRRRPGPSNLTVLSSDRKRLHRVRYWGPQKNGIQHMQKYTNSSANCQTAETIARALRGRKIGREWMARCPAHDDRTPSLSIRDTDGGQVLVHCHAGCDQGRVIATLRMLGLWAENTCASSRPTTCTDRERYKSDAKRSEAALSIWHSATAA